jgi:purine-binding chemotaxis protein CheW
MISDSATNRQRVLILGLRTKVCAVPLVHVIEIMRPLPIEELAGVPSCVEGVAVIRGIPTPVIRLAALLGSPADSPQRFVTLRVDDRQVALAVERVLGVRELETRAQQLPPLLLDASKDIVESIDILDEQLLIVLRAGWELPPEVWHTLIAESVS